MYKVKQLYQEYGDKLGLELIAGRDGLHREIYAPEVQRPGLSLTGYLKGYAQKRLLVLGKVECHYLNDLESSIRVERLQPILTSSTPAVIVARGLSPPKELISLCENKSIPLFGVSLSTMSLLNKLLMFLIDAFAPSLSCHGTLVEVFGVGVLIKGDSSVGKSEAALGLIERGHRLISDDIVKVKKREAGYLEGFGVELSRHHMEIRGIGVINVANLYGAVCVREKKSLDIVVNLEVWDDTHFYDRSGLEDKTIPILGVDIPNHTLPVKPGRDVVLLLETIALNHRLKKMGYHSAREFNAKLLSELERKEALRS